MIHIIYGMRQGSKFFVFHTDIQLFQHHCLKRFPFFNGIFVKSQISVTVQFRFQALYSVALYSDLSLYYHHTVLIKLMFKIQIPTPHSRPNVSESWEGEVQEYAVLTSFLLILIHPKVRKYYITLTLLPLKLIQIGELTHQGPLGKTSELGFRKPELCLRFATQQLYSILFTITQGLSFFMCKRGQVQTQLFKYGLSMYTAQQLQK